MRVYLAAQFKEQNIMKEWSKLLKENKHIVTSRWLLANETETKSTEAYWEAKKDLEDIDEADVVLSKTLSRGDLYTGGGRHIEYGYALAKGKILINIGGYESVFHNLAMTVPTIEEAIELLKRYK